MIAWAIVIMVGSKLLVYSVGATEPGISPELFTNERQCNTVAALLNTEWADIRNADRSVGKFFCVQEFVDKK